MFTYSYGLVFTNRLFSLILSALLVFAFERDSLQLSSAPLYEYSFPSGEPPPLTHTKENPGEGKPGWGPHKSPILSQTHPVRGP